MVTGHVATDDPVFSPEFSKQPHLTNNHSLAENFCPSIVPQDSNPASADPLTAAKCVSRVILKPEDLQGAVKMDLRDHLQNTLQILWLLRDHLQNTGQISQRRLISSDVVFVWKGFVPLSQDF